MTGKRDDLVFDIQELQLEIDEHARKINQLKSAIQAKEQQLQEIPITLERIIAECMVGYNSSIQPQLIENILDRVEVEMLSRKFQSYGEYDEAWNDCLEELKKRLRE